MRDVVPAYRTVLLTFDPCAAEADTFAQRVEAVLHTAAGEHDPGGRLVEIPVCYGGEHGPDLEDVARHTGLPVQEVVRLHAATVYTVEFLGFSPGFAYLRGLPARLAVPRLPTPRLRVPAGSVGIGGPQTGVYPLESPGGWRLIGRAAALRFDPSRPETLPYGPGDMIRFVPVDTYERSAPEEPALAKAPAIAAGLRVVRAGLLATIQDRGRYGWVAQGYGTGGAMDGDALAVANMLAGNDPGAAALEITMDGGEFEAIGDLVIAVAGSDLSPTVDGEPVPLWHACPLRHGSRLRFGAARAGLRAYVAIAGGIDTPPVLGSRATDLVARLGGIEGRALRAGDLIPVAPPREHSGLRLAPPAIPLYGPEITVRVVWGPEDDWFDPETLHRFVHQAFTVSPRSDRTGIRLEGAPVIPRVREDLASEGQSSGAVQVPPDGKPIVLLADGRGVGGYPKIATVISADLHLLGQASTGTVIRFSAVSPAEARVAAREREARLAALPMSTAPETEIRCLLESGDSGGRPVACVHDRCHALSRCAAWRRPARAAPERVGGAAARRRPAETAVWPVRRVPIAQTRGNAQRTGSPDRAQYNGWVPARCRRRRIRR